MGVVSCIYILQRNGSAKENLYMAPSLENMIDDR